MTPEDKVYIANMMKDVKHTADSLQETQPYNRTAKIELNFYRIADAITKMVSE